MPLTYQLEPGDPYARVTGVGTVSLEDALKTIRTIASDLAHHQCGCVTDVREMEYFPPVSELREIAFELIRLRAAFRCGVAFVVGNDKHYSLGRLLAALVETAGLSVGVFREYPEAEAWITERATPAE